MAMLLEVIVQSVADALAAEAGGADRLEVVREIDRDGLTPRMEVVRAIASETRLPLRVMVRESDGFSVTSARELSALQRAIDSCAEIGVDGAVLGFARGVEVDRDTTRAVLSSSPALRVTFHRAFDVARDPLAALDVLQSLPQVDRILTAGGNGDWPTRVRRYDEYASHAGTRLTILAGGGVDEAGLKVLRSAGCVREVHVGRAAREPQIRAAPVSAARVQRLRQIAGH
jgi:copper homeostasis protein